ncbi:MAG: helix-turn-helix transcriptional regulator [Halieaceae bacterium]|nr:helix-turn-helix transcriptional regulator [Halieaceae bacterium]MCP5148271.1 helix-turn-helix transcriptional regulator [Pseudomonadales bacterium]MCP5195072.1 helix-turn-helix transcriptional regulator [Pseudomonadales bacterium]
MSYPSLEQFSQLLAALYGGPQEDPPWQSFLRQTRELLQAKLTVISLRLPRPDDPGVCFIEGMEFDEANRLEYANDYSGMNPFVDLPDGVATSISDLIPPRQLEKTTYYQNHMAPTDNIQVLGLDIYRDNTVGIFLRATRGKKAPPFGEGEKRLFNLLGAHLRQLLEWLDRDKHYRSEHALFENITSRLEMGTILLDGDRRIVNCNPFAAHLLESADGLRVARTRVMAASRGEDQRLQPLLKACCERESDGPALAEAITLTRKDGISKLYVLVKPLASAGSHRSAPSMMDLGEGPGSPRASVYVTMAEELDPGQKEILQQLFNFTPSEAKVAIALANGLSLDDIADELCVSRNTLRTHLRSAFQKTGVNQQSALVSLVLRSVAGLG